MVEIGSQPILGHIVKIYSHYSINALPICFGHKGYCNQGYFANYFLHISDVSI